MTWLFQMSANDDIPGANSQLMIVSEDFYNVNGCASDQHIMDDIIRSTRIPGLEEVISEEAESFFTSKLSEAELRKYLIGTGFFKETKLF